jgi:ribosomal protein S18 acetylase RimI-like enzyme
MPFALDAAAALGLSLRPAKDDDLPFLSALYGSTRADELATTGWPAATKALFVVQQFSGQHGEYLQRFPDLERLIVEEGGAPIGRIYVNLTGETCHLVDISLMPAARGHGRGSALLADLMADAARAGKAVTLSVLASNRAEQLYTRLGFRVTDLGPAYNRMRWTPPRV